MKPLAALLMLAAMAEAQTATLSLSGPTIASVGSSVVLTITLVSGGNPAALQWDMANLPTGAGVTSLVANKTATCSFMRCLLWGMNTAAISDGPIAAITYTQPATATPFSVAATLGASALGAPVTITAPAPITVAVKSPCDVNGDGMIDATDVNLVLQQSLASTIGSPTIVDVIREVIAAMGGACLR